MADRFSAIHIIQHLADNPYKVHTVVKTDNTTHLGSSHLSFSITYDEQTYCAWIQGNSYQFPLAQKELESLWKLEETGNGKSIAAVIAMHSRRTNGP